MKSNLVFAVTLTAGCLGNGKVEDYYSGGPSPKFTELDQGSEQGNVGGDVVTISGKNFGGDTKSITVVFGSQNAQVLSVSPDAITVEVPQGPIQGGKVNVSVGTPSGQGHVPGGYTYDVGELLEEQAGFILVSNQWESCLGGIGKADAGVGCEQIAYVGSTGIEGRAAFMDFQFPNVHSMYIGWATGSDFSSEWKVQTPGHMANTFDTESSFEDLRSPKVEGLRLVNTSWENEAVLADPYWCSDMRHFQEYRYQGGIEGQDYFAPVSIGNGGNTFSEDLGTTLLDDATSDDGTCLESEGRRLNDRRELQFCQIHDYVKPDTYDFEPNWNAGESFFMGLAESDGVLQLDPNAAADILVDVPSIGLEQIVRVPPPVVIYGTQGFDDPGLGGQEDLWGLMDIAACADTNDDGQFDLTDSALTFEWEPYQGDLTEGGAIKASRTQVKFAITVLDIGWFGGVGSPIRATITVPDEHNYDPETGMSRLEVPVWVMYQFPSVENEWGTEATLAGATTLTWGNPYEIDYGYMILTIDRTTEYALENSGLAGDVVFAYSTGDFGFMGWNNPVQGDVPCSDCTDNDGDGWVDRDDPDCLGGDLENNQTFGESTCNDGVDNDGDGLVDAGDDDCEDGLAIESTECGDEIDNDEDGWIDQDDPDCLTGLFENNHELGTYTCNDLVDNDEDGWIDGLDPACPEATREEDDGFLDEDGDGVPDVECNDGEDNDGHGDVDSEDTMCIQKGATFEVEQQELSGECDDGEDNDEDGYLDANDPDCEFSPWGFENREYRDPESYPGIDQCYDGIDNDGDGDIDASDPGCWTALGVPDGYIDDESLEADADADADADTDADADADTDADSDTDTGTGDSGVTGDDTGGSATGDDTGVSGG